MDLCMKDLEGTLIIFLVPYVASLVRVLKTNICVRYRIKWGYNVRAFAWH